jgi:hypothetical protein
MVNLHQRKVFFKSRNVREFEAFQAFLKRQQEETEKETTTVYIKTLPITKTTAVYLLFLLRYGNYYTEPQPQVIDPDNKLVYHIHARRLYWSPHEFSVYPIEELFLANKKSEEMAIIKFNRFLVNYRVYESTAPILFRAMWEFPQPWHRRDPDVIVNPLNHTYDFLAEYWLCPPGTLRADGKQQVFSEERRVFTGGLDQFVRKTYPLKFRVSDAKTVNVAKFERFRNRRMQIPRSMLNVCCRMSNHVVGIKKGTKKAWLAIATHDDHGRRLLGFERCQAHRRMLKESFDPENVYIVTYPMTLSDVGDILILLQFGEVFWEHADPYNPNTNIYHIYTEGIRFHHNELEPFPLKTVRYSTNRKRRYTKRAFCNAYRDSLTRSKVSEFWMQGQSIVID